MTPIGIISLPARFNLLGQVTEDPKYTAVKRDIEQAFQQFRKTTTGAQASDKELRMLRPLVASLTDKPEVFFETINNRIQNIEFNYNDRLNLYKAAGRSTDNFEGILEGRRKPFITVEPADNLTNEQAYQEYLRITGGL